MNKEDIETLIKEHCDTIDKAIYEEVEELRKEVKLWKELYQKEKDKDKSDNDIDLTTVYLNGIYHERELLNSKLKILIKDMRKNGSNYYADWLEGILEGE